MRKTRKDKVLPEPIDLLKEYEELKEKYDRAGKIGAGTELAAKYGVKVNTLQSTLSRARYIETGAKDWPLDFSKRWEETTKELLAKIKGMPDILIVEKDRV